MLRPIPARILRSTATVDVCTGTDRYQNQITSQYTIKHVHIQPTNEIRKTPSGTDCTLRSILFADGRLSTAFDWWSNFESAHAIGGDVKVTIRGVTYTVMSVDALRDDSDNFHHWEIGLA